MAAETERAAETAAAVETERAAATIAKGVAETAQVVEKAKAAETAAAAETAQVAEKATAAETAAAVESVRVAESPRAAATAAETAAAAESTAEGLAVHAAAERTIAGRVVQVVEVGEPGPDAPVCYAFIDRAHGDDANAIAQVAAQRLAQAVEGERAAEGSGASGLQSAASEPAAGDFAEGAHATDEDTAAPATSAPAIAVDAPAPVAPVPFIFVACDADDWNASLSPWPEVKGAYGEAFAGEGPATLAWLLDACIPAIEGARSARPRAIAGYSLAGLFAAWAFLESGAFRGLACCSGSLWFPGWDAWAQGRQAPAGSVAYLSLGKKEPRVRNARIAQVGAATETFADALRGAGAVRASAFVWNPGGHFNDPTGRLGAGIAWTVAHLA